MLRAGGAPDRGKPGGAPDRCKAWRTLPRRGSKLNLRGSELNHTQMLDKLEDIAEAAVSVSAWKRGLNIVGAKTMAAGAKTMAATKAATRTSVQVPLVFGGGLCFFFGGGLCLWL